MIGYALFITWPAVFFYTFSKRQAILRKIQVVRQKLRPVMVEIVKHKIKMPSKGQIVIPRESRERYGYKERDRINRRPFN